MPDERCRSFYSHSRCGRRNARWDFPRGLAVNNPTCSPGLVSDLLAPASSTANSKRRFPPTGLARNDFRVARHAGASGELKLRHLYHYSACSAALRAASDPTCRHIELHGPFLSRKYSEGIRVRFGLLYRGISIVRRRVPEPNWRDCPGVETPSALQ